MVEVKNKEWCMLNTYSVRQLIECFEHFFVRLSLLKMNLFHGAIHTVYIAGFFWESSYTVVNRRDD